VRPNLPPSGTTNPPPPLPPYSPTENRNSDGTLPILDSGAAPFVTGSNYAVAASGLFNNGEGMSMYIDQASPTSATFVDGNATMLQGAFYNYHDPASVVETGSLKEEGGANPVLGWGRWVGGTVSSTFDYSLVDAHYVVGVPTSDAQIAQLTGTYSYDVKGATTPTWSYASGSTTTSGVGTLNSANLSINFMGGQGYTTTFSVNVTADGKNFSVTGTGPSSTSSNFNGSGIDANSNTLQYQGLLAGTNAKFAGVVYGIQESGFNNTNIHGAIGLARP
jgi:hypothetical protein